MRKRLEVVVVRLDIRAEFEFRKWKKNLIGRSCSMLMTFDRNSRTINPQAIHINVVCVVPTNGRSVNGAAAAVRALLRSAHERKTTKGEKRT